MFSYIDIEDMLKDWKLFNVVLRCTPWLVIVHRGIKSDSQRARMYCHGVPFLSVCKTAKCLTFLLTF